VTSQTDLETDDGTLPTDAVTVRDLRAEDVGAIVRIDRASTGRARREYYEAKVTTSLAEAKLKTSLVALLDGHVVGFLLARVYYGEFGHAEPVAVIDSVGVDPAFRKRHVGQALLRQLLMNLGALRVERIETQVDWTQMDLLSFLMRQGFRPAPRLCLERTFDA
jgi:ribosomal protein S18 acetylase RimI-like enzyme